MSHRAEIAIQRGDGRYDLYYSHNGAHDLQLLEQLRDNADALCGSGASPAQLGMATSNVPAIQKWGTSGTGANGQQFTSKLGDDIDSEPIATGVPRQLVGAQVEYDNIEGFYLVEDGRVTPYVPIWLWPNVIRPLRKALEIEVYRGGRLDSDPAQMVERLEDDEPLAVINEETIGRGADWISNSVIYEILRDHHASITALWKMQLEENTAQQHVADAAEGEKPDPCGIVHLSNYIVQFRVLDPDQTPPPSAGLGMLVELPLDPTEADREQVWFRGSKTRFNVGAGFNAMRAEPENEDISDGIADVFLELHDEFGGRISELSPPPTGLIMGKLNQIVEQNNALSTHDEARESMNLSAIRDLISSRQSHPDQLDLPGDDE